MGLVLLCERSPYSLDYLYIFYVVSFPPRQLQNIIVESTTVWRPIFAFLRILAHVTEQMYNLATHGEAVYRKVSNFGFQMMQHIQFEG